VAEDGAFAVGATVSGDHGMAVGRIRHARFNPMHPTLDIISTLALRPALVLQIYLDQR
jgi:hypothetical protein